MTAPRLLMIAPAPVIRRGAEVTLDAKFVEGMRLKSRLWPGPLDVLLREGAGDIPFGARRVDPAAEPFGLRILPADAPLTPADIAGCALVVGSADDDRNLGLRAIARAAGIPYVASLEYTFGTRLRILMLERNRPLPRRLVSALRMMLREGPRRRFLAGAAGFQANGYPAFEACRAKGQRPLLYLDNRMTPSLFATPEEQAARHARLRAGAPLRLVYSGRLEPMKGAQDLVPVACHLHRRGVAFRLDIFGTGALAPEIDKAIAAAGLGAAVHRHDPVDFETALVPHLRRHADLYLCCHRQSDPSCTYLENMGCGLAVAGYANGMWRALQAASDAGWATPLGDPDRLAACIARIDADRPALVARGTNALDFARRHDFETEFRKRMDHLRTIAQPD